MMVSTARALPLLLVLVRWSEAAVPADEITKLPGWDGPLPTKHYSGSVRAAMDAWVLRIRPASNAVRQLHILNF